MESFGDCRKMLKLQALLRQAERGRWLVVDDHASIAVQNAPARRHQRNRFDPVAFGERAVALMFANLQNPKAQDQEKKHARGNILKNRDTGKRKVDVLT